MNFLLSTFGSSGDVFPMLGLALELRKRGHEVTFATNPHYEALSRKHGIPFELLGTEEDFQACINHPDLWHPQRGFKHIFNTVQPVMKRNYQLYFDHAEKKESVGITTCFGFGARFVQEELALQDRTYPLFTLHLQPSVIWSDIQPPKMAGMFGPRWLQRIMYRIGVRFFIDPVCCPFLNEWRSELGLPPIRNVTNYWHSPYGVLCLFPDWFAPPQADWPANVIQTDFPMWNDQSNASLPSELLEFLKAGDPPIAFTPGSTNVHGREFFQAAVQACQSLGRRGLLLTEFPEQLPNPLPASMKHVRYAPFDLLLPRCSALVHHGGIGSASQAMAAGIPQLVMPLAHDQPDNLQRMQKLNIGDGLVPSKFSGPPVAEKLNRLLTSSAVLDSCRKVAERMVRRDGLTRTAVAIEKRVKDVII